jgi:hypothetical protein
MGMVQPRGGARLAVEELELRVAQAPVPLEQLDGDGPREDAVARLEDPGEAAPANLPHQLESVRDDDSREEIDAR